MYLSSLAYVSLTVKALEPSVTFYSRFLDLQLVERFEHTSLLVSSGNKGHFELSLTEGAVGGPVGLGFEIPDQEQFNMAVHFAKLEGMDVQVLSRGVHAFFKLQDPDGNTVELFCKHPQATNYWRGHTQAL